tara:strand:+ start:827 stop:1885 length:1059 start_codon:yes stop_codon:yes gene_type:complete
MSFTYEIDDFFLFTGFQGSIINSENDLESFDPAESLLRIPGSTLLFSNPDAAFPVYTLTGLSNFDYEVTNELNFRSDGYTRLKQAAVLRDYPPIDTYGFLDTTKHFAQTAQRTAYNYDRGSNFEGRLNSSKVNDIVGPSENLENFFRDYINYDFTTIFSNFETYAYIEQDATPSNIMDNNVFEVLSNVTLNNLKIDEEIMDSGFNFIDPPAASNLQKQSKHIPYLFPNNISGIDDSGNLFSVSSAAFNYYFTSFPNQLSNLKSKFKVSERNSSLMSQLLEEKEAQYSAFLEVYKNIDKAFRIRIQQSPKFTMNKLSLYGTMDESTATTDSSSAMVMAPSGMSTGGTGGGSSY